MHINHIRIAWGFGSWWEPWF